MKDNNSVIWKMVKCIMQFQFHEHTNVTIYLNLLCYVREPTQFYAKMMQGFPDFKEIGPSQTKTLLYDSEFVSNQI